VQPPPLRLAPPGLGPSSRNPAILRTTGAILVALLVVGGLASAFRPNATNSEQPGRPERRLWSSRKTKTVQLKIGTATITDDLAGTSHVRVACNNGLVINADWKRNPVNDFGYDIYEPSVNRDFNRLAVMMTARGVIAAYLRGEYD